MIKITKFEQGYYWVSLSESFPEMLYKKVGKDWHLFSKKHEDLGKSQEYDPKTCPEAYLKFEQAVRKLKLEKLLK